MLLLFRIQWTARVLRPGARKLLDHPFMKSIDNLPVFLDIHSAVGQGAHGLFVQVGQFLGPQDLTLFGFFNFASLQKLEGTS